MSEVPAGGARRIPLVAIVGPTGTGKSELGLRLAEELGGEIVNADALQFYRGMDIGTAKLPVAERRGIPHHLLDALEISQEASVAWFQVAARQAVADVAGRGRVPILVGGSGLYVRAAVDELELPGTDPLVRARVERELARDGREALLARLRAVDPESARRVGDDRRLVRALEVHELTGRAFTSFMPRRRYVRPTVQLGLDTERDALNERLERRVDAMLDAGWLAEVRGLESRGLREAPTASRALGYPQLLDVLAGARSLRSARDATVVATRRFAKRQRTWFRADPRVTWFDVAGPEDLAGVLPRALELIRPGYDGASE